MKIDQIKEGSKLIIAIEGKLDAVTSKDLGKVIESEPAGITELIFDLKDLVYSSSAGLRQLLAAQQIMDNQGRMVIKNANEIVMDIFEETGFNFIFEIE